MFTFQFEGDQSHQHLPLFHCFFATRSQSSTAAVAAKRIHQHVTRLPPMLRHRISPSFQSSNFQHTSKHLTFKLSTINILRSWKCFQTSNFPTSLKEDIPNLTLQTFKVSKALISVQTWPPGPAPGPSPGTLSDAVWRYLTLSDAIWHYLTPSAAIKRYLTLDGAIGRYLNAI